MPLRRAHVVGAAALALAAAVPADAVPQVTHDSAGRPITFEVQATGADVAGYTGILDGLLHGAEISAVVVTIVPQSSIESECGGGAVACYRWSSRGGAVMFVPNLPAAEIRPSLAHEYGHHVDATRPHAEGARGLDGTAGWWRARGMGDLLAQGGVAWDYSLGWDRSIAEIYAEDYKLANGAGATSQIRWLGPPPPAVVDALRADLAGPVVAPAPPAPGTPAFQPPPPPGAVAPPAASAPAPGARPRTIARATGRLAAGRRASVGFRVTRSRRIAVRVSGAGPGRLRAVLRCEARALGGAVARRGRPAVVRAARVSPGTCRVTLRALGAPSPFRVVVTARR